MEKLAKYKVKFFLLKKKHWLIFFNLQTLGEEEKGDDALSWVETMRRKEDEKKKAAERAKMLDTMDEEFGVSQILDEDKKKTKKPTSKPKVLN